MFRGGLKGKIALTAMPTLAVSAFLFGKNMEKPATFYSGGFLDSFLFVATTPCCRSAMAGAPRFSQGYAPVRHLAAAR